VFILQGIFQISLVFSNFSLYGLGSEFFQLTVHMDDQFSHHRRQGHFARFLAFFLRVDKTAPGRDCNGSR